MGTFENTESSANKNTLFIDIHSWRREILIAINFIEDFTDLHEERSIRQTLKWQIGRALLQHNGDYAEEQTS